MQTKLKSHGIGVSKNGLSARDDVKSLLRVLTLSYINLKHMLQYIENDC